jgi:CheY-like chemotaxis protein
MRIDRFLMERLVCAATIDPAAVHAIGADPSVEVRGDPGIRLAAVRVSPMAPAGARCEDCPVSTVLIVDDHASFRLQARAVLASAGYEVVGEAADGRTGVEMAGLLEPEIVLLDIGLPDIDGFEVARRLSASASPRAVILTSSRDAAEYGARLADCPVAGFIAKEELSGDAVAALVARAGASIRPRAAQRVRG